MVGERAHSIQDYITSMSDSVSVMPILLARCNLSAGHKSHKLNNDA